jgi:hypothetical protein
VQQNFAAGVGEKYYLLFDVSSLVNMPQSYIMLTASELDSYSYLFTRPTFISLDPTQKPSNIPIAGIRIGMNGAEVGVGQAYLPLSTTITAANYSPTSGEVLSTVGTAIAEENGPALDQIFLTFEKIGTNSHGGLPPVPTPPAPVNTAPYPDWARAPMTSSSTRCRTSPACRSRTAMSRAFRQHPAVAAVGAHRSMRSAPRTSRRWRSWRSCSAASSSTIRPECEVLPRPESGAAGGHVLRNPEQHESRDQSADQQSADHDHGGTQIVTQPTGVGGDDGA